MDSRTGIVFAAILVVLAIIVAALIIEMSINGVGGPTPTPGFPGPIVPTVVIPAG